MYEAQFTSFALECVRSLPKSVRNSLKKAFQKTLLKNPLDCSEKLIGLLAEFRSFHFHDYRVIFKVNEKQGVIAVVGVGKMDASHQKETYRKLEKLAKTGELADSILETIQFLSR